MSLYRSALHQHWQVQCPRRELHVHSLAQCIPPGQEQQAARVSYAATNTCDTNSAFGRRMLLSSVAAASLLGITALVQPAAASVTMTLKSKTQPKQYTLKAGYSITVPDSWSLAYDRSGSSELGTQVFFGNFRTYETLSIFKLERPEAEPGSDSNPEQLLEAVLAEQRNNQSTYTFNLLSGPSPTPRVPDSEQGTASPLTYYDSEYELSICRGVLQEGSGGRRRCVGPKDMDLQIVSRHFYQTFVCDPSGKYMYVVRGSTTSEQWQQDRAAAVEAVQSFRLA